VRVIDPRAFRPHVLDAEGVRALIPHRPPLQLVDGVEALSTQPAALRAFKQVSTDEPVFAGHFPGRPIWPGVFCIEGLAQACAVLGALLDPNAPRRDVLLAQTQVKLTGAVLPGDRLDYQVELTHRMESLSRCEVEATVRGRVVAKGTLTFAEVPQ
jgi:3-hydroxyacyl-[acyl-carrier-protein] dehydratase